MRTTSQEQLCFKLISCSHVPFMLLRSVLGLSAHMRTLQPFRGRTQLRVSILAAVCAPARMDDRRRRGARRSKAGWRRLAGLGLLLAAGLLALPSLRRAAAWVGAYVGHGERSRLQLLLKLLSTEIIMLHIHFGCYFAITIWLSAGFLGRCNFM